MSLVSEPLQACMRIVSLQSVQLVVRSVTSPCTSQAWPLTCPSIFPTMLAVLLPWVNREERGDGGWGGGGGIVRSE